MVDKVEEVSVVDRGFVPRPQEIARRTVVPQRYQEKRVGDRGNSEVESEVK